jgi:pyruvate,orthophosphate dikinase
MSSPKYVYRFQEGAAGMRDLLGGKGANLCEMARLNLPVPPGFVITTEACRAHYGLDGAFPEGLWDTVRHHVREVEEVAGRRFGDSADPLLISVRSGSKFSMPGMMDTVLNLGLNDETVLGLARVTGDERFALDSYRRFIQLFAKVALRVDGDLFEEVLSGVRSGAGVSSDAELDPKALRDVVTQFKAVVSDHSGAEFPDDPWEQLRIAVQAVFESWNNRRAVAYRDHHGIPHDLGTAVSVLAMVFGNSGWDSGTGVCFSRDPSTGDHELYGEYLANAQGEDVVSGVRTPKPIAALAEEMPDIHKQLLRIVQRLERHFHDVQDVEFTIEHGRLYILQTRSAKRTAVAAVKAAVDMAREGLISREDAVGRVPAADLAQLLVPRFNDTAKKEAVRQGRLLARGLNASPGAATGHAVFSAEVAANGHGHGTVILVRPETSADDMPGILKAAAVLTSRGGITSHAAVVTRGLGKPAVVGCTTLRVDPRLRKLSVNDTELGEGDEISIDGFSGEVFAGRIETVTPDIAGNGELTQLLAWTDEIRGLDVRANADTPQDARQALSLGAKGIGLCRTEHMFFQPDRLPYVREMLTSARAVSALEQEVADARDAVEETTGAARETARKGLLAAVEVLADDEDALAYRRALEHLAEYQTADFRDILRVMDGHPVVIRLLDAPLHEFLPPYESLLQEVAVLRATNGHNGELEEKELLLESAKSLHEANPMLGHRGCRLGLTYPDVYEMQVRAIVRAALDLRDEGLNPRPEVMIPLIMDASELHALKGRLERVAEEPEGYDGKSLELPFGTMIELPRAALSAGRIAPKVRFFSFGSNDLTQMTFGFSRDDAEETFLRFYLRRGILPANPFQHLDEDGVGRLIRIAVEEGRQANPDLELGLCGEHGGHPASIDFCHRAGLDYVSCSPLRVPVARLAAAQAALTDRERDV